MKNITAPIFAIDFEGSRKTGVVEYAAAEIDGGEIASLRTRICSPKTPISARDAKFFGINNKTAAEEKPFSSALELFCGLRSAGMFASHNSCVEDSLLRDALASPSAVTNFASNRECTSWGPWIDTCALLRNLYPTLPSAKLSDAVAAFSLNARLDVLAEKFCPENRRKWHCAPYDALACALLLIHICSQDGFENVSLAWLAKYSGTDDAQQMSFF